MNRQALPRLGAGIAVTSIGHCPPRVRAALQQQSQLVHTSNLYLRGPGELAERLVRLVCAPDAPRGKVFFLQQRAGPTRRSSNWLGGWKSRRAAPPKHTVVELVFVEAHRNSIVTIVALFMAHAAGIAATVRTR